LARSAAWEGRTRAETIAFVFGAGASMPTVIGQQDLVRQLLKGGDDPRVRLARSYLQRIFPGLQTDSLRDGTLRFEDVVGPLEIAESEEYWYHFAGLRGAKRNIFITNKEVLDSLDTWVAMKLDPASLPKPPGKRDPDYADRFAAYQDFYSQREESGLPYSRLLHLLRELQLSQNTVFISMNYDILLDRAISAGGGTEPDYAVDGFLDDSKPAAVGEEKRVRIRLLKLHGSLNWRVCDRCHILRNTSAFVVWPNSHCVDCESQTARPMLIRPTLLKDFRHRVWRGVWREAGHALAAASRWIFIGYSLPIADVWMLRLLAQSARSGGIPLSRRRVTVVNPNRDVATRIALLFGKVDSYEQTFATWLDTCYSRKQLL